MAVAEHLVGRAEELGTLDHLLVSLDAGGSLAVEVVGEPGIGKTRLLDELRGSRGDVWAPRPFRIRLRARARPSVRGVRRLARRVPTGFAAGPSRGARRRRPERTGECLPLALGTCDESGSATPTRAISQPPRRPRTPRAADRHHAPGAGARRRPLGRPGVRRSARFSPPAASRGRRPCCHCQSAASRARAAFARPRAGPARRHARPPQARRIDTHRSGRATRSLRRRSNRRRPVRRKRRQPLLSGATRQGRPAHFIARDCRAPRLADRSPRTSARRRGIGRRACAPLRHHVLLAARRGGRRRSLRPRAGRNRSRVRRDVGTRGGG